MPHLGISRHHCRAARKGGQAGGWVGQGVRQVREGSGFSSNAIGRQLAGRACQQPRGVTTRPPPTNSLNAAEQQFACTPIRQGFQQTHSRRCWRRGWVAGPPAGPHPGHSAGTSLRCAAGSPPPGPLGRRQPCTHPAEGHACVGRLQLKSRTGAVGLLLAGREAEGFLCKGVSQAASAVMASCWLAGRQVGWLAGWLACLARKEAA